MSPPATAAELIARDDAARAEALGPGSYIVEAPAGAGKTELLTQRFLALLPRVEDPEEVVALTFTNKAAAEMRMRIVDSLHLAAAGVRPGDDQRHRQVTFDLGRRALAADAERNWGLLRNTGRLQVTTLDALCGRLARQMPFLSRFGAQPAVRADAAPHYRQAARDTLDMLEDEGPAAATVARVLDYFDNDAGRLQTLLEAMLACRDQWLGHAVDPPPAAAVDQALKALLAAELAAAAGAVPARLQESVMAAARHAASQALLAEPPPPRLAGLADWTRPLGGAVDDLPRWRALADLLLTADGTARKVLPPKLGLGEKAAKPHAEALKAAFAALRADPAAEAALARVRGLPDPQGDAEEARLVADLIELVRLAAGRLWLVFQEQRETDFIQVARNALQALGDDDGSSDLRERLDYRIGHLLVDEFQDTSPTQVELLEKLTAGWQADDGRTLFLVGDPMQSIYRFRKADVGLFLKVRNRGIGQIRPTPLRLYRNNRSYAEVVDWANRVFPQVFAAEDDLRRGAVRFTPSAAARGPRDDARVAVHPLIAAAERGGSDAAEGDDAPPTPADRREAQQVIALVREVRARNPQGSVAILVRARSHLARLTAELRRQGGDLRYQAVEIETLGERQAVQDLLALTRALHHRADRVNWLAVLRAPWCGLLLADLHVLAADDHRRTLWQLMHEEPRVARLSADGRKRLTHLRGVFAEAFAHQGRQRPRRWVEGVWQRLGGPYCLHDAGDLLDVQACLQLLDGLDVRGSLDLERLDDELERLFAAPDPVGGAVQVMTVHKSKGLEFDTVILPGLHRTPPPPERSLLMWDQAVLDDGREHLLVAAIPPARSRRGTARKALPSRYDYLREFEKARADNESRRVLYVAATRAVRELHLFAVATPNPAGEPPLKPPASGSLLALLWDAVAPAFVEAAACNPPQATGDAANPRVDAASFVPALVRLADPHIPSPLRPLPPPAVAEAPAAAVPAGGLEADIGTLVHRYLEMIARDGIAAWPAARIDTLAPRLADWFVRRGHGTADARDAAQAVAAMLATALASATGRWLLEPHPAGAAELAITEPGTAAPRTHVVDRTFIADGVRWVVDYKTARHPEGELAAAAFAHRPQLERYAALFADEGRELRAAVYFVAHDRLLEVPLSPGA